jgi:hypothetical protein
LSRICALRNAANRAVWWLAPVPLFSIQVSIIPVTGPAKRSKDGQISRAPLRQFLTVYTSESRIDNYVLGSQASVDRRKLIALVR